MTSVKQRLTHADGIRLRRAESVRWGRRLPAARTAQAGTTSVFISLRLAITSIH